MNKLKFRSILMLMIMPMLMACGSDDKTPEYVGEWYRTKIASDGKSATLAYFDMQRNSMRVVVYMFEGNNLNLSTLYEISNIKKESGTASLSETNNIVKVTVNSLHGEFKYAVIDNMLVFTDIKTGDLYSAYKMTKEMKGNIDKLDKIALDVTKPTSSDTNADITPISPNYFVILNYTDLDWANTVLEFYNDKGNKISETKVYQVDRTKRVDVPKSGHSFIVRFDDENGTQHRSKQYLVQNVVYVQEL